MIDTDEVRTHAGAWGTTESQIRKDHLISHLLCALAGLQGFVFFGGTAINRTYLDGRLSEDVDLFLVPSDPADPDVIIGALREATRREYPDLNVALTGTLQDARSYTAATEGLVVQVQIVGPRHENSRYPTHVRGVALRYSDLPDQVALCVPTRDAFVVMKCAAYEDRAAPRDLFDLGALADIDAIGPSAIEALRHFRGNGPTRWPYDDGRCPSARQWAAELSHQTRQAGDPLEVLRRVRAALALTCGWRED